jgi:hypothetical protein
MWPQIISWLKARKGSATREDAAARTESNTTSRRRPVGQPTERRAHLQTVGDAFFQDIAVIATKDVANAYPNGSTDFFCFISLHNIVRIRSSRGETALPAVCAKLVEEEEQSAARLRAQKISSKPHRPSNHS